MTQVYPDDRTRALALLREHGWNATSFQILEPGFRYWFDGPDCCVAYIDTGRAWVAAGAPIAPPQLVGVAAQRFVVAAAAQRRRACFFGTEERFASTTPFEAMRVGEQPVWDPRLWEQTVNATASLRAQIRRARAKQVEVRRFDPQLLAETDGQARRDVDALIARWQAAHPMPPMGFLVQMHLDSAVEERRFFAAYRSSAGTLEGGPHPPATTSAGLSAPPSRRDDRLVGFCSMVPVFARRGWFIEDLLRSPDAPNGTPELLVDAAMRTAAAEDSAYVTLGLAPLAGELGPWLRLARRTGHPLYDFRGVQAFKAKLRPQSWSPVHVSYPRAQSGIATVVDVLAAFARGGLLRFGVRTLLRRPGVLIQALALVLVPWTILIALADAHRWFPSPAVKWAWVGFDAALAPALSSLARRWRRGLDTLLASLVTADAVLTGVQLVTWNLRREPHSALTWIVGAVSVLAPALAAALLWAGRRSGRAGG
jgi:phosphatidylglycerol lysyltransferase